MFQLLIWVLGSFLCGAFPFSVWVGRLTLRTDIRRYGDGNPGATNLFRAGGRGWGALALFLDALKGALPVGLAYFGAGLTDWRLIPIAMAPILGHAFSPFLGFRGGKAVAVTFGVWAGLTIWQGPVVLGLALGVFFLTQAVDGWSVVLAMVVLLGFLLLVQAPSPWLFVWLGNTLLLAWKHRAELRLRPTPKPWLHQIGRQRWS